MLPTTSTCRYTFTETTQTLIPSPPEPPFIPAKEIEMKISERFEIDVAADRCTIVPILGCLTTIPRMLFSSIIGCSTCMCACLSGNPKCHYITKRAHLECCRGLWESIPFGILCLNEQIRSQKNLGVVSTSNYGKYIYQDPSTGNVFYSSEKDLKVFGWATHRTTCDESDNGCNCACLCPTESPVTKFLTQHEVESLKITHNLLTPDNVCFERPVKPPKYKTVSRAISLSPEEALRIKPNIFSSPQIESMRLQAPTTEAILNE